MSRHAVYSSINLSLPPNNRRGYLSFVNSLGGIGDKENPSHFETRLPEDWRSDGCSRDSESVFSTQYIFLEHPEGLSIEEIIRITRSALDFGAETIGIKGISR